MNWSEYIHADPAVMTGKPVVRGTRLTVEFLRGLVESGWTEEQVLENDPHLSPESLRAVVASAPS